MNLDLLRPFDLALAKAGEPVCNKSELVLKLVAGPDRDGDLVLLNEKDNVLCMTSAQHLCMAPLAWVQERPVYKGDKLVAESHSDGKPQTVVGVDAYDGNPVIKFEGWRSGGRFLCHCTWPKEPLAILDGKPLNVDDTVYHTERAGAFKVIGPGYEPGETLHCEQDGYKRFNLKLENLLWEERNPVLCQVQGKDVVAGDELWHQGIRVKVLTHSGHGRLLVRSDSHDIYLDSNMLTWTEPPKTKALYQWAWCTDEGRWYEGDLFAATEKEFRDRVGHTGPLVRLDRTKIEVPV